jgi:alkanesulfonate monooxygenase SsuD/methylene tetrahydromethanopterin reductase-like flavin-dependent oxidoreductase (luciferase family)
MGSDFRFGYAATTFAGVDTLIEDAVQVEQAGFDSVTVADLPGALSPLVALDQISDGRLEIALGSGIPQPSVAGIMPPDGPARFERLRATTSALKSSFDDPGITPGFANRPRLRIAGAGDRVVRLAAAEADGFIIASAPPVPKVQLPPGTLALPEPAAAEAFLQRFRGYAEGRADQLEIGTGVEIVLTDDAPSEAQRLAATHTYLSPDQVLSSPKILIGTPEDIGVQILERVERYGITLYVMHGTHPISSEPSWPTCELLSQTNMTSRLRNRSRPGFRQRMLCEQTC